MSEFKKYVASLYPDDTAVIEDWSEKDFIEDYGDLYEKFKKDKGLISEFDMFCAKSGILDWCDEEEVEKIWNHQQAKIDELQARIDATEAWIEANKKTIALSEWHGYTTEEYVDADDLLDTLKGNKDEN